MSVLSQTSVYKKSQEACPDVSLSSLGRKCPGVGAAEKLRLCKAQVSYDGTYG